MAEINVMQKVNRISAHALCFRYFFLKKDYELQSTNVKAIKNKNDFIIQQIL